MKSRKNIYIIIGTVLILLNLLVHIISVREVEEDKSFSYHVGAFIGSNLFIIIGSILLRQAYILHKKIIRISANSILQTDINNIGKKI
jgi:hypothetical protein